MHWSWVLHTCCLTICILWYMSTVWCPWCWCWQVFFQYLVVFTASAFITALSVDTFLGTGTEDLTLIHICNKNRQTKCFFCFFCMVKVRWVIQRERSGHCKFLNSEIIHHDPKTIYQREIGLYIWFTMDFHNFLVGIWDDGTVSPICHPFAILIHLWSCILDVVLAIHVSGRMN